MKRLRRTKAEEERRWDCPLERTKLRIIRTRRSFSTRSLKRWTQEAALQHREASNGCDEFVGGSCLRTLDCRKSSSANETGMED